MKDISKTSIVLFTILIIVIFICLFFIVYIYFKLERYKQSNDVSYTTLNSENISANSLYSNEIKSKNITSDKSSFKEIISDTGSFTSVSSNNINLSQDISANRGNFVQIDTTDLNIQGTANINDIVTIDVQTSDLQSTNIVASDIQSETIISNSIEVSDLTVNNINTDNILVNADINVYNPVLYKYNDKNIFLPGTLLSTGKLILNNQTNTLSVSIELDSYVHEYQTDIPISIDDFSSKIELRNNQYYITIEFSKDMDTMFSFDNLFVYTGTLSQNVYTLLIPIIESNQRVCTMRCYMDNNILNPLNQEILYTGDYMLSFKLIST